MNTAVQWPSKNELVFQGVQHFHCLANQHFKVLADHLFQGVAVLCCSFFFFEVPFAQPKNAIIGNTLGGLVGVCVHPPGTRSASKFCRL